MFSHRFTIKTALILLLVAVMMNASMWVQSAIAQPAAQINYQGKLTDGSGVAVPDGAYNMRFWLLQSTSQATTSAVWTESLTGTEQVSVVNGLFSVMLGSTSPLTAVDFNQPLYLGIEIGGTSGTPTWDGEMLPRKPLGTVLAAFEAYQVGGVASSSLLRSDQADTATGLLTFSNGIISTASSTISDLTFSTATGTTLVLGGEQFTDFTGTGLVNEAGVLSVSSSSLNISLEGLTDVTAMTKTLGDLLYWNGTEWADIATSSLGIDTTADNLADNSLEELQDVATMTKTLGDLLYWNGTEWADIATSSLGLGNGTFLGLSDTPASYTASRIMFTNAGGTALTDTANFVFDGTNLGIGTSSPTAKLTLETTGFSGAGTVGINQYLQTENSVNGAVQFGNNFYLHASNTATTTLVGSMLRIKDDTSFANTVRGLEIQTNRGVNTYGENTALSAFARTFGVRAVTSGDAGAVFEPAAGFFETEGTTQGNAMRGYSDTITTASLLALFHSSSTFAGTGLEMNFGNGAGSFSSSTSKYLDFQNGGNSVFTVSAFGTTTIGDGTTNNMASLQIGFGGICVDNDGSCTATSTGWVVADGFAAGNSDLAEMYFSRTALQTGELVMMTGSLSVDRATKDSTLPILGVVSTKPGLTIGSDDTSLTAGEQAYPIALSGRVPVKLSNENGPIKRGDALMLSTLPGVAMKATATGTTIGIALEDFDEERLYSETYVNQFGDDLVDPVYEPIFTVYDARIDDGCYYSGGNAVGEAPCIPLSATTSAAMVAEANEIAEEESVAKQLQALRDAQSEVEILADGRAVQVGQLVMFVEKGYRWLDNAQMAALGVLVATSSVSEQGENEEETLFDRLVALANRFVDGVLSVFTLKAERVETSELCVDGVCIDAAALRQLLEGTEQSASPAALVPEEPSGPAVSENPPPTPDSTEDVSTDIEMSSTTEETSPTTSEESTEQPSTNSDKHEIIEPIEEQNDSGVTTEESEEVAIAPAEASFSEAETESETILPESVAPIAGE